MINKTLSECKALKPIIIDYKAEGEKIRDTNLNMLIDLLDISKDSEFLKISSLPRVENSIKLPIKMTKFYNTYFNPTKKKVANNTIFSKIKKEISFLDVKITNFAEKNNIDEKVLRAEIESSQILKYFFMKSPEKQTYHQHFAAKKLKESALIEDLKELPAGGENALYLAHGTVIKNKDYKGPKNVKSIDMSWNYKFKDKVLTFYITHKYTKENGGGQDNQYNDVKAYIKEASENIYDDVCFLSITDGIYYQKKDSSIKNKKMKRITYLNKLGNANVLATTTNTLEKDIAPVIINWLQNNFDKTEIKEEIEKLETIKALY